MLTIYDILNTKLEANSDLQLVSAAWISAPFTNTSVRVEKQSLLCILMTVRKEPARTCTQLAAEVVQTEQNRS
jgi:hypothetical protein